MSFFFPKELAGILRRRIENESGGSVSSFAARYGVHRSEIYRLLSGNRAPSVETLAKLGYCLMYAEIPSLVPSRNAKPKGRSKSK